MDASFVTVTLLFNLSDALNFPAIIVIVRIRLYSESKPYQITLIKLTCYLVNGIKQVPTLLLHSYRKSQ